MGQKCTRTLYLMALPLLAAVFAGCAADGDDYGYYDRRDYQTAREEARDRREGDPSEETVRDEMYVEEIPPDFSIHGYVGPDMIDSQSGFFDSDAPSYYTQDWFKFEKDSLSDWAGPSGSSGEEAQNED